MRFVLTFFFSVSIVFAACADSALAGYSESSLRRAAAEGGFSFAGSVTGEFAAASAGKNHELPLFLALGLPMVSMPRGTSYSAERANKRRAAFFPHWLCILILVLGMAALIGGNVFAWSFLYGRSSRQRPFASEEGLIVSEPAPAPARPVPESPPPHASSPIDETAPPPV